MWDFEILLFVLLQMDWKHKQANLTTTTHLVSLDKIYLDTSNIYKVKTSVECS